MNLVEATVRVEVPPPHCRVVQGQLQQLAGGDLSITVDGSTSFAVGEGVRAKLYIRGMLDAEASGQVTWVQASKHGTGADEVRVTVADLSLEVRQVITRHLAVPGRSARGDAVQVMVIPKYFVWSKFGQLGFWINGTLDASESHGLYNQVARALAQSHVSKLLIYIDAERMSPCPAESQPHLIRCFAMLGQRSHSLGVMHVECAATRLQLRRLARDAGISEAIVCFEHRADADLFWAQIAVTGGTSGTFPRLEIG